MIIWSVHDGQIIKHFQKQSSSQQLGGVSNYGIMGMAAGSGQSGNPLDEQKTMVQELNWSQDMTFLCAVINDCIAIIDMRKIGRVSAPGPLPQGTTIGPL